LVKLTYVCLGELLEIDKMPIISAFDRITLARHMKYGQNLSNIVDLQGLSLEVQHPPAVPLPNHAFSQLYPSFVGLHFI
jgi:hypothetical protein